VAVHPGGTVAPGTNGVGTLSVAGTASFAAGSVFAVDAGAQADRLIIDGAAALSGGTVQVTERPGVGSATFIILTAQGGITGSFSGAISTLPFLFPSLTYTGTDVLLSLARDPVFLTRLASTPNQLGVAGVLDGGPLSDLYIAAAGQGAAGAQKGLDLLSGEVHASAATAAIQESGLVRDAALERLRSFGGSLLAPGATVPIAYSADAPQQQPLGAMPSPTFNARRFGVWVRASARGAGPMQA
jgi:outer membrane autotransporter protein